MSALHPPNFETDSMTRLEASMASSNSSHSFEANFFRSATLGKGSLAFRFRITSSRAATPGPYPIFLKTMS